MRSTRLLLLAAVAATLVYWQAAADPTCDSRSYPLDGSALEPVSRRESGARNLGAQCTRATPPPRPGARRRGRGIPDCGHRERVEARGRERKGRGQRAERSLPRPSNIRLHPPTQQVATQQPVSDLRWVGRPSDPDKYVFAVTDPPRGAVGGRLWWSPDGGKSWSDATDRLSGAFDSSPAGAPSSLKGIVDTWAHPASPLRVLVQGAGTSNWVSDDGGVTFSRVETPGSTLGWYADIKLHPTKPDWILAKVRRTACATPDARAGRDPAACAFDLFASLDFAHTWKNLTAASGGAVAAFWDFEWGAALKAEGARATTAPDARILATGYTSAAHVKGPRPGWDVDMHFFVSDTWFAGKKSHRLVAACGNQVEVVGETLYVAVPETCPTHPDGSPASPPPGASRSNVALYVSRDEGSSFTRACLPSRYMSLGFSLTKTHDGSGALLAVDHDETDPTAAAAPAGSVYAPGGGAATGAYSLSLPRTRRAHGTSDVARVEGVPGAFLANQLDEGAMPPPGGAHHAPVRYGDRVRTRITFNGGGKWSDVDAPAAVQHAQCARCSPGATGAACSIHLHGPSSWHDGPGGRPSFYSHAAAPGTVMAVGNAGAHLDTAADALCTWLSTDGGATWRDVAPGAGIYEFGGNGRGGGGVIALARHEVDGPTDTLRFSADGGHCWHTVRLSEPLDLQNIRIEPRGASHTFIAHGKACARSAARGCTFDPASSPGPAPGRMYVVDVAALLGTGARACTPSDYELWSPRGGAGCLLGRNVTLARRARGADCLTAEDAVPPSPPAPKCACTLDDVECEYGFERGPGGECVRVQGVDPGSCSALGAHNYAASATGRRLVHGDVCTGVSAVIPDTDGRGGTRGGGGALRVVRLVALTLGGVVAAAALLAGAAAVASSSGGLSTSLEAATGGVLDAAVAVVDSARRGGARLRATIDDALASRRGGAAGDYVELPGGGVDLGLDLAPGEDAGATALL